MFAIASLTVEAPDATGRADGSWSPGKAGIFMENDIVHHASAFRPNSTCACASQNSA
jgi:hypothetical protein